MGQASLAQHLFFLHLQKDQKINLLKKHLEARREEEERERMALNGNCRLRGGGSNNADLSRDGNQRGEAECATC